MNKNHIKQIIKEEIEKILKESEDHYVVSKFVDEDPKSYDAIRYDVHLNGKNVAYASLKPKSGEGDGPWISGLFVSADHRGKGLARKLLAAIEEDYVGQTLRLRAKPYKDKAKSKEALIRLYTSLGFAPYDDEGRMFKKV